jgi:hypothetical protein
LPATPGCLPCRACCSLGFPPGSRCCYLAHPLQPRGFQQTSHRASRARSRAAHEPGHSRVEQSAAPRRPRRHRPHEAMAAACQKTQSRGGWLAQTLVVIGHGVPTSLAKHARLPAQPAVGDALPSPGATLPRSRAGSHRPLGNLQWAERPHRPGLYGRLRRAPAAGRPSSSSFLLAQRKPHSSSSRSAPRRSSQASGPRRDYCLPVSPSAPGKCCLEAPEPRPWLSLEHAVGRERLAHSIDPTRFEQRRGLKANQTCI